MGNRRLVPHLFPMCNDPLFTLALNLSHNPHRLELVIVHGADVVAIFRPDSAQEWRKTLFSLGLAGMATSEYAWHIIGTSRLMFDLLTLPTPPNTRYGKKAPSS